MSTQTITVRVQSSVIDLLNKARGSEPVANFVRRVLVEKLNGEQQNSAVITAITQAKAEIIKTLNAMVAE